MRTLSAPLNSLLDRFEDAWRSGPPEIAEFLPQNDPDRRQLLIEMVRIDLELRWESGPESGIERLRVADYASRFPEIGSLAELPADLIREEFLARRRAGDPVDFEEYSTLFPQVREEIAIWQSEIPVDSAAQVPARGFDVLDEVARGGMGVILRVRDQQFDRHLAIKVLQHRWEQTPQAVERFLAEAAIQGELQHPGVPPVHEVGNLPDGRLFFSMKLIDGETLADHFPKDRDSSTEIPKLLDMVEQVCQTVGFAHSRGIIHRDLKPHNVMVGAFGEVQVMDWGMAKKMDGRTEVRTGGTPVSTSDVPEAAAETVLLGSAGQSTANQLTQAGEVLGTPAYMPPEQARGDLASLDARADVFSIGAILCELLTGTPPWQGANAVEILDQAAKGGNPTGALERLDQPAIDADLAAITKRCLASSPKDRPANAAVVAEELAQYRQSTRARLEEERVTRAAAEARAEQERRLRRRGLVLAAAVGLLVVGGVAFWSWRAIQENELAARATTVTRDIVTALDSAEKNLDEIAVQTSSRKRFRDWANNPARWHAMLVSATAEIERAESLRDRSGIEIEAAVLSRIDSLRRKRIDYGKARSDASMLEDVRLAAITDRGLRAVWTQMAVQFETVFRDRGIVPEKQTLQEAAANIKDFAIVFAWVDALDCWAHAELRAGKANRADWLFAVANQLDDDTFRQQIRSRRTLGDAQQLGELAANRSAMDLSPMLLSLLTDALVDVGRGNTAQQVLQQAMIANRNDFWLWVEIGQSARKVEDQIIAYRAALALRPQTPECLNNLGVALATQKREPEAIAAFREALGLRENLAPAHTNLANMLRKQKQWGEAEQHARRAIALDKSIATSHYNLGLILYERGETQPENLKLAAPHLETAIAIEKKNGSVYVEAIEVLGSALTLMGKHAEAQKLLNDLATSQPESERTAFYLGVAFEKQNKLKLARQQFEKVVRLHPGLAKGHFNLGTVCYRLGDKTQAEKSLREAVRLDESNWQAALQLNVVLRDRYALEEAETVARKAFEIAPKSEAEPTIALAETLTARRKPGEAQQLLLKLIKGGAKSPHAHVALASAYQMQRNYSQADAECRQALEIDDKHARAYYTLGIIAAEQRKLPGAISHYRTAIKYDPTHAQCWSNLGNALRNLGKLSDAASAYKEAVRLDPGSPAIRFNYGNALRNLKQYELAEVEYLKGIFLDKSMPHPYAGMGLLRVAQGRFDDAIDYFQKSVDAVPQNSPLRMQFVSRLSQCRRLKGLDDLLARQRGADLSALDARSAVQLAGFGMVYSRCPLTIARLYRHAFEKDARLLKAARPRHRFDAAIAAARAVQSQQDEAAKLTAEERKKWETQSAKWLEGEFQFWSNFAATNPRAVNVARHQLRSWLSHPILPGLRTPLWTSIRDRVRELDRIAAKDRKPLKSLRP